MPYIEHMNTRPWQGVAVLAMAASVASGSLVPSPALARNVVSARVARSLGVKQASEVESRSACPKPKVGSFTCYAQVLVNKRTGRPVRPRLAPSEPSSTMATASRNTLRGVPAPEENSPAYLQQVYDLSSLSAHAGAGDTVAVIGFYWDATAASDLEVYRRHYHLPPCTLTDGCLREVNQAGGTVPLSTCKPTPEEDCRPHETSLDLDAVSALCPRCHILLIQTSTHSFSDAIVAEREAVTLGANQISNSFGSLIAGNPEEYGLLNSQFSFPGVATVASSGDHFYAGGTLSSYPAALPGVTAVGGTSLENSTQSTAQARGWDESVWNSSIFGGGTNSGCDTFVPKPPWQHDTGCKGRAYNDISADADPDTGLNVYDSQNGGWERMGGTSLATPLVAAYYGLIGHGAGVGGPSWDYTNSSLLNDIVGGNNLATVLGTTPAPTCAAVIAYICNATPGYNGPTGNGSISGAVVAGAPGIGGPTENIFYVNAGISGTEEGGYASTVGRAKAMMYAGIYPNQRRTSYWWEYGSSAAYGFVTATVTITKQPVPGVGGVVPVKSSIECLSPGKHYHYRLAAHNALGTSYSYDFTFTTKFAKESPWCGASIISVKTRRARKAHKVLVRIRCSAPTPCAPLISLAGGSTSRAVGHLRPWRSTTIAFNLSAAVKSETFRLHEGGSQKPTSKRTVRL